jgi:hypothetical protein
MHYFKRCFFITCLFFAYQYCNDTSCDEIIKHIKVNSLQNDCDKFFEYIGSKIKEKGNYLLEELKNKLQQCSDSKEFTEGSCFKKVELINEIYVNFIHNEGNQQRIFIHSLYDSLSKNFEKYSNELMHFFKNTHPSIVFKNIPHLCRCQCFYDGAYLIKEEFSNKYDKEIEKYRLLRNSIVCAIYITIPFVGAFFIYKIYKYFKNRNYKKNKNLKNN